VRGHERGSDVHTNDHRRHESGGRVLPAGHRGGGGALHTSLCRSPDAAETTQLFGEDSARPADNHSIIIEFRVADVDTEYERLRPLVKDWVQAPTTMPWGNRSILFRDPDGNLVNLFAPVTDAAIKKFGADGEMGVKSR
jgi:uncharacterized glyoxalase superfamily protein PhnB